MIVSADLFGREDTATSVLPLKIRRYFYGIDTKDISEVRLRCGRVVKVVTGGEIKTLLKSGKFSQSNKNAVITTRADIEDAVEILTASSLYSYQDEIKNGYITAPNGCRVGLCGTMTADGNFVDNITSLNYRFAREIIGAADKAFSAVYNGGDIKNTLIISKPGCGKTTFLRDLVRQISNKGVNISVVDERGELSGAYDCFDLGENTDVFRMCRKADGLKMMIRSMAPMVAAVDEIGGADDVEAIEYASKCGVSVIATIHGDDPKKDVDSKILSCFRCIVRLSDKCGQIREIVNV